MLWRWHAWRRTKPIRAELRADREQLARGPEDWLGWWRARGQGELRCILMTAWDPIGVSDEPGAWDEYDDYVPGVARRLRDAPDPEQGAESVLEYLRRVERDFMELEQAPDGRGDISTVAYGLAAWHEWSYRQGGRAAILDDPPGPT